jgi:hypothetical protein
VSECFFLDGSSDFRGDDTQLRIPLQQQRIAPTIDKRESIVSKSSKKSTEQTIMQTVTENSVKQQTTTSTLPKPTKGFADDSVIKSESKESIIPSARDQESAASYSFDKENPFTTVQSLLTTTGTSSL